MVNKGSCPAGLSILTNSFQHRLPSTSFQARFLFGKIYAIRTCSEIRRGRSAKQFHNGTTTSAHLTQLLQLGLPLSHSEKGVSELADSLRFC